MKPPAGILSIPTRRRAPILCAAAAALIVNVAVAGGSLGLQWLGWLGHLELRVLQHRMGSGPIPPNPEILLVGIARDTPHRLGLEQPTPPLPRRFHAELLRLLREAGTRVVILDLVFTGTGADDEALRTELSRSAPMKVVLAADAPDPEPQPDAPGGYLYTFSDPVVLPAPPARQNPNVIVASPVPFSPDNVLRGAFLGLPDQGSSRWLPHLALAAVVTAQGAAVPTWDPGRHLVTAPPMAWLVGEDGELMVRWTTDRHRFPQIEYSEALQALQDARARERFRDKIVIVGDGSGADQHPSPLGRMAGMEFVAHVLNTLLLPSFSEVGRWSIPQNALWGLALSLVAALAVGTGRAAPVLGGVIGASAAAIALPDLVLGRFHVWVDTLGPLLSVLLAATLTGLVQTVREGGLARRFAPAHVLAGRPDALTEVATVLFVDLQNSTALAEKIGPVAVQELLVKLLSGLSAGVARHGGEVERTLGDGLLAVFRERGRQGHAVRCVQCTRTLLKTTARISEEWRRIHQVTARITFGIEAGVISGAVIRTADREEWSSFGPTVNLARRIQEQCGPMGAETLLGPTAHALVQHHFRTRLLGAFPLKGISGATPLYRIES